MTHHQQQQPMKFQSQIQQLTRKITTINQPQSILIQRQSKCHSHFQQLKSLIQQKSQLIEQQLYLIQQRVTKYEKKIHSTKQLIKNYSLDKCEKFKQIIYEYVEQFELRLKRAKQQLREYQTTTQNKMLQMDNNNSVIINNLRQKINKNLNKANQLIQNISILTKQQREQIMRQFDSNKIKIQTIYKQKVQKQKYTSKLIQDSLQEMQIRLMTKMKMLQQKWHVKDQKTQRILQVFIESKELF